MNDEIKIILNNFKKHLKENYKDYLNGAVNSTEYYISCGDIKILLDYITDLQVENDITESYEETCKEQHEEIEKSQQRIDNAIEYIEDNTYKCYETDYMDLTGIKELLNILNGGDE